MKRRAISCIFLTLALVASPLQARAASVIYAATDWGPYRSADDGLTWEPLIGKVGQPHPLLQGMPQTVAAVVDPTDPSTAYFATNFTFNASSGMLKTTDGGETWSAALLFGISLGAANAQWGVANRLAIDPVAANILYLAANGDVHKSIDSGVTWNPVSLPTQTNAPSFVTALATDPGISGVLYALTGSDIYKSTDFGSTWTLLADNLNLPLRDSQLRLGDLLVDPVNSNVLYVTHWATCIGVVPESACGLLKSIDGGVTWTSTGIPGPVHNVAFDPRTGHYFAGAKLTGLGDAILKSTDGGNIWNPIATLFGGLAGPRIASDTEEGSAVYAIRGGPGLTRSFSRSTDGGASWAELELPPICDRNPNVACPYGGGSNLRSDSPVINVFAFPARPAGPVTNVSAASSRGGVLAGGSIVSAYGANLANATAEAQSTPLPATLAGTTVTITDSRGVRHQAQLFYVSREQVNYLIPPEMAPGVATATITTGDGVSSSQQITIAEVSPGLFTLNRAGLAAATVLRVSGGVQTYEDVFRIDATSSIVPRPIDLGPPTDEVYLILYGTGFRNAGTERTTVTIDGESMTVMYSGPQGGFAGLDQSNILVSRSMAGRGEVELVLTGAGQASNAVRLTFAAPQAAR